MEEKARLEINYPSIIDALDKHAIKRAPKYKPLSDLLKAVK